jgi:hypothetical protein
MGRRWCCGLEQRSIEGFDAHRGGNGVGPVGTPIGTHEEIPAFAGMRQWVRAVRRLSE